MTPEQHAAEVAYRSVVDNDRALRNFIHDLNTNHERTVSGMPIKFPDDNIMRLTGYAIERGVTDAGLLTTMSYHGDAQVRAMVARNPHTPSDARDRLLTDPDTTVKKAARAIGCDQERKRSELTE